MFRYIIIIIIYEVPTPGRAEKNGADQEPAPVPTTKSRAEKKVVLKNKSRAKKRKSCRKQKSRAEKKSRAKKKKSCRKKESCQKKRSCRKKKSRARENWRREKETWWEKLDGTNWAPYNWANISKKICPEMLIFGKSVLWIMEAVLSEYPDKSHNFYDASFELWPKGQLAL